MLIFQGVTGWKIPRIKTILYQTIWMAMEVIVTTVDGSEIRRSPVEVGSLSHDLRRVLEPSQVVSRISSIKNNRNYMYQMMDFPASHLSFSGRIPQT